MLTRILAVVVLLVTLVPSAAFAAASPHMLSLVPAPSVDAPLIMVLQWPMCAIAAWFASRMIGRLISSLLSFGTI